MGATMADYLRLRQICLVARELEPVIADIRAILGLDVCYRDSGVAKYGLVNALLPIATSFLEVVAPVGPNTAAGRFLDRSGGHGGAMAVVDLRGPARRGPPPLGDADTHPNTRAPPGEPRHL